MSTLEFVPIKNIFHGSGQNEDIVRKTKFNACLLKEHLKDIF